jgi:hypothetical protein
VDGKIVPRETETTLLDNLVDFGVPQVTHVYE